MIKNYILIAFATVAVIGVCHKTYAEEVYSLVMGGSVLTSKEIEKLEQVISKKPTDVSSRTKLLGYYFTNQFQNDSVRSTRQKHILWLIKNSPESEVLSLPYGHLDYILDADAYSQGKKIWKEHLVSCVDYEHKFVDTF